MPLLTKPRVTMAQMIASTQFYLGQRHGPFKQRSRQVKINLVQARLLTDRVGPYMDLIFDTISRRVGPPRASRMRVDPQGPFQRPDPTTRGYGMKARQRMPDRFSADVHRVVIHQYGDTPINAQRMSKFAPTWVHCSCPWFCFVCEFALAKLGSSLIVNCNGRPPRITNPRRLPVVCKHIWAIMDRFTGIRRFSRASPAAVREVDYSAGIDMGTGRPLKTSSQQRRDRAQQQRQAAYTGRASEGLAQLDKRINESERELLRKAALMDEELYDLFGDI
jgi:hypothetical protein